MTKTWLEDYFGNGSGGDVEVGGDIGKSDGETIDSVLALRGRALPATPATVPGTSPIYRNVGGSGFKWARGSQHVSFLDFGADPTGGSDDTNALKTAIEQIGGAGAKGGGLFFPEGIFNITDNVVCNKPLHARGSGMTSGNGGTELRLAAGKSIVFAAYNMGQQYDGPYSLANDSLLSGLGIIKSAKATTTKWTAGAHVTVGTKRIVAATSLIEMDVYRHVYLECIKEGDCHASVHPTPTEPDIFSKEFELNRAYRVGELVRGSTNGLAIAANGSNLITSAFFRCTVAGTSHPSTRPTWDTTHGNPTTSGDATFVALSTANYWSQDGTAVWAHKFDGGIISYTKAHLDHLYISGAGGPGVYFRGNSSGTITTNANGWTARNLRIVQCALGFMAHGSDAGAGFGVMIDIEGAGKGMPAAADVRTSGGVGIYDASGVGNTWIACQVANVPNNPFDDPTGGGYHSYLTNNAASWAKFLGCYAEGYGSAPNPIISAHLPGPNTRVDGGPISCGFTTREYPAADGTWTNAQRNLDVGNGGNRSQVYQSQLASGSDQQKTGTTGRIEADPDDIGSTNARNPVNGLMTLRVGYKMTGNPTLAFSNGGATITRSTGDWAADGFTIGHKCVVVRKDAPTGSILNDFVLNAVGPNGATIIGVTTTVLTLSFVTGALVTESGQTKYMVHGIAADKALTTEDVGRYVQTSGAATSGYNTDVGKGFLIAAGGHAAKMYVINHKASSSQTAADANNVTWTVGGGQIRTYLGTEDAGGSALTYANPMYPSAARVGTYYAGVFTDGGPFPGKDWWVHSANALNANISHYWSGLYSTFGADGAAIGEPIFAVKSRLWIGTNADYLRSIEYGSVVPVTVLRRAQGSVCFNKLFDGTTNSPIGWMCTSTGSPGTWKAIRHVSEDDIETNAANASTSATTANQVVGTQTLPSAAASKVDVYLISATFIGGGNAGRVTCEVKGTFIVSAAGAITRLGTDDVGTVKGTGTIGSSSAFNFNISGADIQARVTPGSATATDWKVLFQLQKLKGTTA